MAYEPKLPDGVTLPEGFRVDVEDVRFKALHDLATREKWTQKAFSDVLGIEARRVSAEHVRARAAQPAPSPAPAPKPGVPEGFSKMSFAAQATYALANPKRG